MRGQSYLGRIASAAATPGPRLSIPSAATGDPAGTPSLASLLRHLSDPSATPRPVAEEAAREAAPAEAAPAEPIFPAPTPGPQPRRLTLPIRNPAAAATAASRAAAPLPRPERAASPGESDASAERPPRRLGSEERSASLPSPGDAAATQIPPPSRLTVPPVAVPAAQRREGTAGPPQAAESAPVHVHIGTVEVRAAAPQVAAPTATPEPAAATAPMPPRGYGTRFGLLQR